MRVRACASVSSKGLNITYNLVTKGMNGSMEAYNVSFTYNKNEYTGAEFRLELPYE